MTQKRFTIADYPTDIIDNETGEKYPCSSYSTHMDIICDLLNELNDENEQLKSACTKYNINPKNLERVLDDFDSMLDWEYSGNLNDDGEYK